MSRIVALIVAAGSGERAKGADSTPKQYRRVAGQAVLRRAIETFRTHPQVDAVRVVISGKDRPAYDAATQGLGILDPVNGGATRQESVRLGLESLAPQKPARVLIHDAARPFVSQALIGRVIGALESVAATAPYVAVADTLRKKKTDGSYEIVSRENLFRAQTPQGFRYDDILAAHRKFAGEQVTDDVALAERAGLSFAAVPGEEDNMKLTTAEDFRLAEKLAGGLLDIRTGTGFDVHHFGEVKDGSHIWLCGVKIPHESSMVSHSDADCGLHALTDAVLGAIADADIGKHFPPSDPKWKGAPSHKFLSFAAERVRALGGVIAHVDVTIICERPKIGPHRETMRENLAKILGIDLSRVSVKATTTDGLGFTGRREGIAAQAVATVRLPL